MDKTFAELVDKVMPVANPDVMKGLAFRDLPKAREYLDSIMASAAKSYPEGTTFEGSDVCTPEEEFRYDTRTTNSRRVGDIARSDIRLHRFRLSFNGVPLRPIYYYVPFCAPGGISHLSGNMIHFIPTLQDTVISPSQKGVFIRLARDRINAVRLLHSVLENGRMKSSSVVHVPLLHRKPKTAVKVQATTKAATVLLHYLLAKFGFTTSMSRYFNIHPLVFDSKESIEGIDLDEYDVFTSCGVKPSGFIGNGYIPSEITVLVKKLETNADTVSVMCSFFYIADNFVGQFRAKDIDNVNNWRIILGSIIYSGNHGYGKLLDSTTDHLRSLDHYLDQVIDEQLKTMGYHVGDFYGLLVLVMKKYDEWVANVGSATGNGIGGKGLAVLAPLLYPITHNIFTTVFEASKANNRKVLDVTAINQIITSKSRPRTVFDLTGDKHPAVSSVSCSGDNMHPNMTSRVARKQPNAGSSKRIQIDYSMRGDPDMLINGGVLGIRKSDPDPNSIVNMYIRLCPLTNMILPKPEFDDILDDVADGLDQTNH